MGFHIGPRVLSGTGGSIDHKNGFRIHHFPPKITERGLLFNLDFGDKRCEPGWNGGSTDVFGDISGNGRNFTRSGGEPWTSYAGGVRHFDGSNDSIYRTDTSLFTVGTKFTIEFSFRFETGSTRQGLVSSHMSLGGSHQDAIEIEITTSNTLMTGFRRNPGASFSQVQGSALSTNTWYHAAMVVDGSDIRQYNNGSLIGTTGITNNSIIALPTVTPTLVIGRYASHYLHGQMGYVRMYDRSLSPTEIARNYKAMKIRTESSADYTDTFTPTCSGEKGKVEVLVVGSGANGGSDVGGGGGGAQVVHNPSFTVTSGTSIGLTVGGIRLGDQSGANNPHGADGRSSVFSTITALGGNGGNGRTGTKSTAGMHGGGGSYSYTAVTNPDGGGNAGGDSVGRGTGNNGNGGGGGAGGVGETGTASVKAGDGAPGVVHDISGEPVAYGAGGGGSYYNTSGYRGYGGSGVGGDGGESGTSAGTIGASSARHGTGSGGGGGQSSGEPYNAGHGGHGTVIVRYPAEEYVMEVLVVGGGGGGGSTANNDGGGSGGGGGGVLFDSSFKVSSGKNYAVSVGTGGNRSNDNGITHGVNGKNSFFDTMIAIGGGGGGSTRDDDPVPSGGSGGGAGSDVSPDTGGSGTPGQGFDGGNNSTGNTGAGGGGAGAPGTSVLYNSDVPNGGIGKAFSISGSSTYYGGGGGGGKYQNGTGNPGTGGSGGGGNGGKGANGSNATDNTGGGGGGGGKAGSTTKEGGEGGSGIVIIAYKGSQRGEGGTVSTTARPGYTTHTFTAHGEDTFIA